MNVLLDTHTFIWFVTGDSQLSISARKAIEDPDSENFISMASLWEMSVKVNIGKLELGKPFSKVIDDVNNNGMQLLPIHFSHLAEYVSLELHHRDPFDRLLIAQSQAENMPIISRDTVFDDYQIDRIW